ncbi:hypothetical protein SAMN05444373_100632 [Thermoclostridium caenicola]|uniref:MotA/TolQ/ExbB proton channel family protein n=1 Tax=Thermoclostridium caenicola TaxID=659425 RepID=A0A1M6CYL7_9FIRM|nr:hypothetical protein SAMN05444373_100632 [Thermoclostridium caenicola]
MTVLDGLISLYRQLGGVGTFITLLIMFIFIGASYANTLVRRRYISLSEELAGYCAGDLKEFSSDMLQWIAEEYREAAESGLSGINTLSIIQTGMEVCLKPCLLAERFLKRTNSLLITTGLFGTFIGLTYAVGNMGDIMSSTNADTLMQETGADVLALLISSFKGMAVAFVTSLLGTGFSILFMVTSSLFSAAAAKELLITQLEEYLDIKVASEVMEQLRQDDKDGEDLVQKTAQDLGEAIGVFEQLVSGFSDCLKGLKNFNEDFSANIGQFRASSGYLCDSLDRTSQAISECGARISRCAETLEGIIDEIQASNRRLENMTSVISDLRICLDDSRKDREMFLKAVYEIPDRLLNYHEAAVASVDRRQVNP